MSSVQTASGQLYDLLRPKPEQIKLFDIAHALSQQCRFGGHNHSFYSVAQHSLLVSYLIEPKYALLGLLHDAGETYVLDLPSPIKQLLCQPNSQVRYLHHPDLTGTVAEHPSMYHPLEANALKAIYRCYGERMPGPEAFEALKVADLLALRHEATVWLKGGPARQANGRPWWEPLRIEELANTWPADSPTPASLPWVQSLLIKALPPPHVRRCYLQRLFQLTG